MRFMMVDRKGAEPAAVQKGAEPAAVQRGAEPKVLKISVYLQLD